MKRLLDVAYQANLMLKVALIGATGAVGQEFVLALNKHPWFELSTVVSSSRSAGKKYVDSLRDPSSAILRWHSRNEIPDYVRDMIVTTVDHVRPESFDLVFTAGYDYNPHIITRMTDRFETTSSAPFSQSDIKLHSLYAELSILFSFDKSNLKKALECKFPKQRKR